MQLQSMITGTLLEYDLQSGKWRIVGKICMPITGEASAGKGAQQIGQKVMKKLSTYLLSCAVSVVFTTKVT